MYDVSREHTQSKLATMVVVLALAFAAICFFKFNL
jgi:hypothetical protein